MPNEQISKEKVLIWLDLEPIGCFKENEAI